MPTKELQQLAVYKTLCSDSLESFVRYFFVKNHGRKFVMGEHHKQICAALEKVFNGETTRLIINLPPRYSKTEIAVKNFIAFCLARNPRAKFIQASYSSELSLDNAEAVKDLIQSDAYRQMFPDVQIKSGSSAKHKFYTTHGGGLYSTSSGGQITGFGAGSVDAESDDED